MTMTVCQIARTTHGVEIAESADHGVRLCVVGALDARTAETFAAAADLAFDERPEELDLDLRGVTDAGAEGVTAVSACLARGRFLVRGVRVAVATDAGRRLLLASMSTV